MDIEYAKTLLGTGRQQGRLSQAAEQMIISSAFFGRVAESFTISPDSWLESSVFGVTIVADDSGSIESAGREQDVIDGTNLALDTLAGVDHASQMMAQVVSINGRVILPFATVESIGRLNRSNYSAIHGTRLYDTSIMVMTYNALFVEVFKAATIRARTSSLIVTDGQDQHSQRKIGDAFVVIDGLRNLKRKSHLIAAMGIGANEDLFRDIFTRMGIPERWHFLPGDDQETLMALYTEFSRASSEASRDGNFGAVDSQGPSHDGERGGEASDDIID